MDLIKGIVVSVLAIAIVGFGLVAGFFFSVLLTILSAVAMIGAMIVGVAYVLYDAIRTPPS